MNIQKRLQIEFEFLGEEQISANTALKIINDVFKEAETEQLTIGGVINCIDCGKPLPKDSESNTCTECFYKDRYKYS